MTVGVPFIENPSKREATKKAFEIIEAGADSLMCQNWNLEWMAHLSKFRIPFQSHVGFIPRRTTWIGGIRSFGKTANEAAELFRDIKDIEKKMGREATFRFGPRIIDIDIIFFNGQEINDESLTIPHKEWKNRLFVIAPLYEVLDKKIEESKFNISNQKVIRIGSIKI